MFRNPTTDLIVVLVIVLLIFGPKRLPQLGRQLGHGMREFKDGITGKSKDSGDSERPEITQTSASSAAEAPIPGASERQAAEVVSPERRP
jgi:sec-independent protein translocase protein TatA